MLTLLLMRHAKASQDDPLLADRQRGLTERGEKDAKHMGRFLKERGLVPHVILSSTAERARATVNILIKSSSFGHDIFFYNELYESDLRHYFTLLNRVDPNTASPVLIVGHNPEMEIFLQSLCASNERMATANIAQIEVQLDAWASFNLDTRCKLRQVWRPKELP
jgi:phosphohistidine phosphatase